MWMIVAACILSTAGPTVEIRSTDGASAIGTLVELDAQHVVLQRPGGRENWEMEKLAAVSVQSPKVAPAALPPVAIELVDGSSLAAESISTQQDGGQINLADHQRVDVPVRDIKSVRFGPLNESTTQSWSRIVKEASAADMLVIKKANSIDYHKGVIGRVTDDAVEFQLDGERLSVKRAKIFGLVYRRSSGREVPESIGRLSDHGGSTWAIQSISLTGQNLQWTTPLGIKVNRPLDGVAAVDFSRGQVAYLSDLTPDSVEWIPYFSAGKPLPAQMALFAPRRDSNLESGPLQLDQKRYAKGLAVHSRTTLVYRLPERYRSLTAMVGIDDLVRPRGKRASGDPRRRTTAVGDVGHRAGARAAH